MAVSTANSCGDAATQVRNGRQTSSACCWSSPWKTMAILRVFPGPKAICSPQYGLKRLSWYKQMVLAGEVDRRHHVGGLAGHHRIHAGRRGPAIDPAGRLRQTDLIADVIRI